MQVKLWKLFAAPALGALLLTGCAADDEELLLPETERVGGEIFDRYVALGNSITAGFMSGGINDSTQALAYPVLLARQAGLEIGTEFVVPFLARPGCPPPLAAPFSSQRVTVPGQTGPVACALRTGATRIPNNLAVPGAQIGSATNAGVAANALTTFILGGATPVERMLELEPTLVTSWLGNNDALTAARYGNVAVLTETPVFSQSLSGLVAAIEQTPAGAQDAVALIGVVDPAFVPIIQPGVFAFIAAQDPATARLLGKPVSPTCSPVTATGQPNPQAFNFVSLEALNDPRVTEITCANNPAAERDYVVTPAELQAIRARTTEFNALLRTTAQANGWIFINPNELLAPFLNDPTALRRCQALTPQVFAQGREAIGRAVATTCPNPQAGFGSLITFDAFHPSAAAHRLVTNAIITALNARFSLGIPLLPTAGA